MNQKRMTYGELRDVLDKLSPEQLGMPVLWTGEDRGGAVARVEVLDERHVDFGEGLEPWSSYAGDGDELEPTEAVTSYPAGTVFLVSDD